MGIEEKKEKLKYFINNNNIDLTGTGSNFNGNAVNLIGYSLYIGVLNYSTIDTILSNFGVYPSEDMEDTFDFAQRKNYGDWWKNENNRKKFNTLG